MHDNPVLRVHLQAGHVAHQVGGQLGGELAAVLVAPQQLGGGAVLGDADDAQIVLRVLLHILEVFAGAGDDKVLADEGSGVKAGGDGADDVVHVQVLGNLGLAEQVADIAAVALVPAHAVHVGGGALHLLHKGSGQNIFHCVSSLLSHISWRNRLLKSSTVASLGLPGAQASAAADWARNSRSSSFMAGSLVGMPTSTDSWRTASMAALR